MFIRLPETKVFRDPIHGYIHVELQVVWQLIDSYAFQRLRRIHQLGGTHMVYHTAEHSRFGHSLGVYEIIRRMVTEIESLHTQLTEYDQVTVMLAGLLHDLGHGPFSHAFESIAKTNHEAMTIHIITEDPEISTILSNADKQLADAIVQVINHTHKNQLLSQLVSSQLDADRMDYLLRDSYFTGTSYGTFDLERILRTLRVHNNKLVVKESGIHSVEDYIMSRYHMYWQVYFHPLSRSYEAMLSNLFLRLHDLYQYNPDDVADYPMFLSFLKNENITVYDFLAMDEPAMLYGIQTMRSSKDIILRDLSDRILRRQLFEYRLIETEEQVVAQKKQLEMAGFDPKYYFYQDKLSKEPYLPYVSKDNDVIEVLTENSEVVELSMASIIVSSIIKGKNKNDHRMFFPESIK